MRPSRRLTLRLACTLAAAIAGAAVTVSTATVHFYPDDPLVREPDPSDAGGAKAQDISLTYEMAMGLFATAGREPSATRARNVNTIDEVPDSSWFTNRVGTAPVALDALARGPNTGPAPAPAKWTVIREKSSGYSPGFTARDANGETWFVSFDSPGNPEGATAAVAVANKLFWALGYNQVETFLTSVDPAAVDIDANATIRRPNGKRTPFSRDDLNAVLERARKSRDGTYRAAAARLLTGAILGPFRYEGTRSDDPNDVVPHEHRRELRALRVFGAWTNLTDMKAGNTLDTLVVENGRKVVKHYLQDVGSTFGIGANGPHDWDEGFEYFYEGGSTKRRLFSLGLALSPWQTADYQEHPAIGRFEGDVFDPTTWKPHWATRAYIEMQPDDAFWAARRVAAFSDEMIRAAVKTGAFTDAVAEKLLGDVLIKRRDKIVKAYLGAVNPIVAPALDGSGRLTFTNVAVDAGVGARPSGYRAEWFEFDNVTGQTRPLGESRGSGTLVTQPKALPTAAGSFLEVRVSAEGGVPASWSQPVRIHFRREGAGWKLVGLKR